jgi:uncharacterized protein DUF5996
MSAVAVALPPLPLDEWEPTKDTLHLWCQIVGKMRLASTAPRNHWWHVPLYLGVRGLTTRRMHANGVSFEIAFDFVDHRLTIATNRGDVESFELRDGLSVAEFGRELHATLDRLGIDVTIRETPFGVPMTTPFLEDREHASYDRDAVERFWRILDWTDEILEEFAGWYCGKTSPVHFFWHSLDLAVTRFGGRRAPVPPTAGAVTREAYSHEVVSFGFWAGDQKMREPGFASARWRLRRHSGPSSRAARSPSCPTRPFVPQPTRDARCSRSSRAPTGPAQAWPAGIRTSLPRRGVPWRPSSASCSQSDPLRMLERSPAEPAPSACRSPSAV